MKTVKLTVPGLLIDDVVRENGSIVAVPDVRAHELVGLGHAEFSDGTHENGGTNLLADAIEPAPPGGTPFNPVEALAPVVAQHPGLAGLKAATRTKTATAGTFVDQADVVAPTDAVDKDAEAHPDATAAEMVPPRSNRSETASLSPATSKAATRIGKAE